MSALTCPRGLPHPPRPQRSGHLCRALSDARGCVASVCELFYWEVISAHHFSSFQVFADRANQSLAVQVTSAFEQVAVLTGPWLSGVLPEAGREALPAELRREVRTLGGRLQLFLQVTGLQVPLRTPLLSKCSLTSSHLRHARDQTSRVFRSAFCVKSVDWMFNT